MCKKTTTWEENPNRPFCSERCKLLDLGKWVFEEYKIPGEKAEEEKKRRKIRIETNTFLSHSLILSACMLATKPPFRLYLLPA